MGGTERVDELDSNEVPLPPLPEAADPMEQPDPHAPAGSEAETKAEEAYTETLNRTGP